MKVIANMKALIIAIIITIITDNAMTIIVIIKIIAFMSYLNIFLLQANSIIYHY